MNPFAAISGYFTRLAPRERILVGVGGATALLLLLYSFVWEPLQEQRDSVSTNITRAERSLDEIQKLRDTYFETKQRIAANEAALTRSDERFNLFSYVQSTVRDAVSADRIASMNPSTRDVGTNFVEERVEIKITQIGLDAITDLVYRIEKGTNPLRFSRLQIKKRRDDPYTFDVTATVSLLKATSEGEGEES